MTILDPIGDMLTRIRNAQMRHKETTLTPGSKLRARVLDVLQSEGYIRGYTVRDGEHGQKVFEIELKYDEGTPVIRRLSRISTPGRRVYANANSIPRIENGLGVAIMSTSKGVMADHTARAENVGGEVLCQVF